MPVFVKLPHGAVLALPEIKDAGGPLVFWGARVALLRRVLDALEAGGSDDSLPAAIARAIDSLQKAEANIANPPMPI